MWIKNINFPITVINALANDNLVIFAGAGVSMEQPSQLPSFVGLAEEIAGRTLEPEERKYVDKYLGESAESGIDVINRTKQIISRPDSKPTQLHCSIVSLFRPAGHIRIVTTNFDKHFTTAAQKVFQEFETFYAPALPLGNNFDGLVYLHGSVEKDVSQLVLTDRDFGKAYLTEGWATRFLLELFSHYTVLFIGYSHDDPVMKYLARGLPYDSKNRFALSDKSEGWHYLGVEPIVFPLMDDYDNKYFRLFEAMKRWTDLSNMGALDHEKQIKQIVEKGPPLEREQADYVANALTSLITTRFFTRYAKTPEWLNWAEKQEIFQQLFTTDGVQNDITQDLANWFAECYVCKFPGEALELVQRYNQQFSSELWHTVAWRLAISDLLPDPQWLSKWVAVLVESAPLNCRVEDLELILDNCRYPEDCNTALLLFEYLTRPKLKLEKHISFFDPEKRGVDAEIEIKAEDYHLRESWQKFFRPNLNYFKSQLENILTNHFTRSYLLLASMGQVHNKYDQISASRSAIEAHEQDRHSNEFSILIDAASDLVNPKRTIRSWNLPFQNHRAKDIQF